MLVVTTLASFSLPDFFAFTRKSYFAEQVSISSHSSFLLLSNFSLIMLARFKRSFVSLVVTFIADREPCQGV